MTYSIVAIDPMSRQIGVAVQSHYFGTGAIVPWAQAGVGAVATQSIARVEYGPSGLAAMIDGKDAATALSSCLAADPEPDVRQVAMVDASGGAAAHTGSRCIPEAGHRVGDGFVTAANLMHHGTVWDTMAAAFIEAPGDLADRLLAAMWAAESEGGDIRGRQSAAMVIVALDSPRTSSQRGLDLRVEDHTEPLDELARLLRTWRAYREADLGDDALGADDIERAQGHYARAVELRPDIVELQFWAAVAEYSSGNRLAALDRFRWVFTRERRWTELLPRLAKVRMFASDTAAINEVLAVADPNAPW